MTIIPTSTIGDAATDHADVVISEEVKREKFFEMLPPDVDTLLQILLENYEIDPEIFKKNCDGILKNLASWCKNVMPLLSGDSASVELQTRIEGAINYFQTKNAYRKLPSILEKIIDVLDTKI